MQEYIPHKSDKSNKKYLLLQKIIKKYISVHLARVILLFTKMKQENIDI